MIENKKIGITLIKPSGLYDENTVFMINSQYT